MDTCSYVVGKLVNKGLLTCLNPQARNSRLYWLTDLGRQCRRQLHQESGLECKVYSLQDVDWDLYGTICFSHRSIVMRMLTEPMQPSEIKRAIRKRKAGMKISANNIRDVIRLLLAKEIVQKVYARKKAHPRYELTNSGTKLRELLIQAEMSY